MSNSVPTARQGRAVAVGSCSKGHVYRRDFSTLERTARQTQNRLGEKTLYRALVRLALLLLTRQNHPDFSPHQSGVMVIAGKVPASR
jgi:hypothetical protein